MLGEPLTEAQRAELEHMGAKSVRLKIATYGGGHLSMIGGFRSGDIRRDFIEEWLAEKNGEEKQERDQKALQQTQTLFWAKVGGVAAVIAAIAAIVTIAIMLIK
jgi:hypothetical protein